MGKRSMNFRGKAGSHSTLEGYVATLKAMGKTDAEIIAAVKAMQEKLTKQASQ